jgi:opacity protein-like surface antigen
MKKVLAISIMAALLLSVAIAAMATETNWQLLLKATDLQDKNFNTNLSIGCQATFTDGVDTGKGEPTAPTSPGGGSTIATVAAVLANDALSTRDFKQPITEAGSTAIKTWTIKLYSLSSSGPALDGIKLLVTPSTSVAPVYTIGGVAYKYTFTASFIPGGSVVYNAAKPMPTSFSWTASQVDLANAYVLNVTAAPDVVTPEPSSMVALASGLFGLVGFGIRRRK